MADDDTQEHDDDDDTQEPEALDKETVQGWVKEALADLLPGKEPAKAKAEPDDDEPITLRAIEKAARSAVEDAMSDLQAALERKQASRKTPAKKPAPKAEPEEAPAAKGTSWKDKLWGTND